MTTTLEASTDSITYERLRAVGQRLWFEYHCNESHESIHAEWWYRSQQQVEVIKVDLGDGEGIASFIERLECGQLITYFVKFADGFHADVFEDELLDSPSEFSRPAPSPPSSRTFREGAIDMSKQQLYPAHQLSRGIDVWDGGQYFRPCVYAGEKLVWHGGKMRDQAEAWSAAEAQKKRMSEPEELPDALSIQGHEQESGHVDGLI